MPEQEALQQLAEQILDGFDPELPHAAVVAVEVAPDQVQTLKGVLEQQLRLLGADSPAVHVAAIPPTNEGRSAIQRLNVERDLLTRHLHALVLAFEALDQVERAQAWAPDLWRYVTVIQGKYAPSQAQHQRNQPSTTRNQSRKQNPSLYRSSKLPSQPVPPPRAKPALDSSPLSQPDAWYSPPYVPSPPHLLRQLLLSLFASAELHDFLRKVPDHERILPMLPSRQASPAHISSAAADILWRRRLVDRAFFQSLADVFPNRIHEIRSVETRILGPRAI